MFNKSSHITFFEKIDMKDPYAYHGNIIFTEEYTQITIPDHIDMIYDIICDGTVFEYVDNNIKVLKKDFILMSSISCPICIRIKWNSLENRNINFTAVIFKSKKTRSKL
jgi:hypothetical protein